MGVRHAGAESHRSLTATVRRKTMTSRIKPLYAVMATIVILSLAVVSVFSFSPRSTEAQKASTVGSLARNQASETITFSDWQFPDTLNPYQTTLAVSQEVLNGMFEGLFMYDQKA